MNTDEIENALWIGSFIGQIILLVVLIFRRCARVYPIFTTRIAYLSITTVGLFFVMRYGTRSDYFRGYWAVAFLDFILQLGVVYEMARHIHRPAGTWVAETKKSLILWSILSFGAAATIGLSIHIPGQSGLSLWAIQANVATSILTCAVFLAVSLSADRVFLQWTNHDMAIGEGLTFWCFISLIEQTAHLATGWNINQRAYDDVGTAAYLISILFWIVAFSFPESKRTPLSKEMQGRIASLHEQTLADLHRIESATDNLKRDKRATK